MKSDFQFTNLIGTVYSRGNVIFTKNGTCILSPVGNRISCFDLIKNENFTFPFENRRNITLLAVNSSETLLLSVDEQGKAILCNLKRRIILHRFNFNEQVFSIKFSPNGRVFAVGLAKHVQVWHSPNILESRELSPFVLHRKYAGHFDQVTRIEWSGDSRFFLTSSKDLTSRIYSIDPEEGFKPTVLSGHNDYVLAAFFTSSQETIYTVSKDGAVFEWAFMPYENSTIEDDRWAWNVRQKHFFSKDQTKVSSCDYFEKNGLLAVGFSDGTFSIYELPEFLKLHSLSISNFSVDFCSINHTGDWIVFASSKLGQMLVWEWQSESYIFKQQGHSDFITSLTYTNDGQSVATAADDGKIKIWNLRSGFCTVTFDQHAAAVTDVCFAKFGNVLFSSSLDGTVRAFDLLRYRNFRVFAANTQIQFSCVAVDAEAEVVCAGCIDTFDIYVWSVQTGQLLEKLSGHEGPVSCLLFSDHGGRLASGSWDHSVRIWDIYKSSQPVEPLNTMTDVLAISLRPDNRVICIATLDGELNFWNIEEGRQIASINCRKDISGGRKVDDVFTAEKSASSKYFTSVTYTANAGQVIAAGNSKYVCIYDVETLVLINKLQLSSNYSLDGTREFLDSRLNTEAGPIELIDRQGENSDLEDRIDRTLPGASRGDLSKRKFRPEIRCSKVKISPLSDTIAAATTEGLLLFSQDNSLNFDPFDIDLDLTTTSINQKLIEREYLVALVMAIKLNESSYKKKVYFNIPIDEMETIVSSIPKVYIPQILHFIRSIIEDSPNLEYNLRWISYLLKYHGLDMKANSQALQTDLKSIFGAIRRFNSDIITL